MRIYGVLLAGGQSSRMGQDKALLNLTQEDNLFSLMYKKIDHVVSLYRTLNDTEKHMIVSLKKNDQSPHKHHVSAFFVEDIVEQKGPLGGIFSVCKCLKNKIDLFPNSYAVSVEENLTDKEQENWLLLLPVDMPFLDDKLLSFLLDKAISCHDLDIDACVFENHEFPLCLKQNQRTMQVLNQLLNAQDTRKSGLSIRYLLSQLRTLIVKPPENTSYEWTWFNINQPQDWLQAQKTYNNS